MQHVLLLEMLTWCLVMSYVTKTGVWVVAVSLMFFSQLILLVCYMQCTVFLEVLIIISRKLVSY